MDLKEAAEFINNIVSYRHKFRKEDFIEFSVKKAKLAAIDGSSIKILDGGSFSIFLLRVGYVIANGDKISKHVSNISVEIVEDEKKIDEIRTRMENDMAKKLDADVILMDGVPENIEENVVGISKKSSYKISGIPATFLVKKEGDRILPGKRWYYKLDENIYVVKFHPYARFAFRADAIGDIEEKFAKIAWFCNEISSIGYPFPLAMVHRMVEIKREEAEHIKNVLKSNSKVSYEEWENIFYDYHEYIG